MNTIDLKKNDKIRAIMKVCMKTIGVLLLAIVLSTVLVYIQDDNQHSVDFKVAQIKFVSLWTFLALLFPFFGVKKTAKWMFEKRWLIGALILLYLVMGKYHGDSLTMYNMYIQKNSGNEFTQPLFGQGRGIRSDDWVVSTPSILSNEFAETPYSKYNDILQGRETDNAVAYANTKNILSIGSNIFTFLFGKINVEYAFSFYWYAPIFLCFLSTIEIGMIISHKNKIASFIGGILIAGSSWFLWWGFPNALIYAQMSIVLGYYLIKSTTIYKKIISGFGFSVFFSCFICCLYPAWQVPIAYIALVFVIYFLYENWSIMKNWRYEWLIVLCMLGLVAVFVGYYLYSAKDYLQAIMQTVYPGERRDSGGMIIQRMFYGFMAPLFGIQSIQNPTMNSIVFSFFPIPLVLINWSMIKEKKLDILKVGFTVLSIYLILYCTVGLPEGLAKVTLISMSTISKAVEILSVLQVYILIIAIAEIKKMPKVSQNIAIVVGLCYSILSYVLCSMAVKQYMSILYVIFMSGIITITITVLLSKNGKQYYYKIWIGIIGITVVQAAFIRPVSCGLDSIYSKPVAKEIRKICETDKSGKWIAVTDNIMVSGYMVACGAKTINSTNRYPNMQLWEKLDSHGKYSDVYNRYSHIFMDLVDEETSFELVKSDVMRIHLNYEDLETLDVQYIMTTLPLKKNNDYVSLKKIYDEDECYIYKVIYK